MDELGQKGIKEPELIKAHSRFYSIMLDEIDEK